MIELTTCYHCKADVVAPKGTVHPLCKACTDTHDDWMMNELRKIGVIK